MIDNIAIIGASGAIGAEFTRQLAILYPSAIVHAFSRYSAQESADNIVHHSIDYLAESSISAAAGLATKDAKLDMVIVATGMLHNDEVAPEKSLRDLSADKFRCLFEVNTILPALIAKHFIPKLVSGRRCVFVALSARVGSISDNYLGGWHAYRASKAALNMIIKNAAIEVRRKNKQALIVGLHPGTVDSNLSKPFQANVPDGKLFTAEFSVMRMLEVITGMPATDTGKCFAWDGLEIKP